MNVYENLKFQREKFPEIFRQYANKNNDLANREVAQTYIEDDDINYKNEILIYCDNFREILHDLIHINYELIKKIEDEIDSVDSIVITYSFEEKVIKDELGSSFKIYFPRALTTKFLDIRLTRKINNNLLDRSVNVICLKELNLFDKMKLEKIEYKKIESLDELREIFVKYNFCYNKISYSRKEKIKETTNYVNFIDEIYEIIVGLEICHELQKSETIEEVSIYKIGNICMGKFYNEAMKILKKYVVDDNFHKNYLVIEIYLKYFNYTKRKVDEFISKNIIDEIREIYSNKTLNARLYTELLKSDIHKLDDILSNEITKMNKAIEENVRKVS